MFFFLVVKVGGINNVSFMGSTTATYLGGKQLVCLSCVNCFYMRPLYMIYVIMQRRRRDLYIKDMNSNESSLQLEGTKKLGRLLDAGRTIFFCLYIIDIRG